MQKYNDETLKELFFSKGLEAIEDVDQLFRFATLYPKGFIPESLLVHLFIKRACELTAKLSGNDFLTNTGIATLVPIKN